jgi:hypothetical protein
MAPAGGELIKRPPSRRPLLYSRADTRRNPEPASQQGARDGVAQKVQRRLLRR